MITIGEILNSHIVPFEYEDIKTKRLFSYFLHLAPTISSSSAKELSINDYNDVWERVSDGLALDSKNCKIYASGYIKVDQLKTYKLCDNDTANRSTKRVVCCEKNSSETEIECFLRHIRNSIAHSNVYVLDKRRKYVIFDDYNKNKHLTARLLLSQTDLEKVRKIIEK